MSWQNHYIGMPFAEKGRDVKGVDCWGLVRLIYQRERNIILPSYLECYADTTDSDHIGREISEQRHVNWQPVEKPEPFDLVILRLQGVPMHVGVVTKAPFMIHSAQGVNVALERVDGMRWKNRVNGYVRYSGE